MNVCVYIYSKAATIKKVCTSTYMYMCVCIYIYMSLCIRICASTSRVMFLYMYDVALPHFLFRICNSFSWLCERIFCVIKTGM